MGRPRKKPENLVVTEAQDEAPMPEHDTRDQVAEPAPVEAPVPVEESEALDVPDVSVPAKPSDDKAVDEDKAVSVEDEVPSGNVLFADVGLTVHVLMSRKPLKNMFGDDLYDVKGRVLSPGESVALEDLPPYLVKDLEDGKVSGARIVSVEEAERLNVEAAHIRALTEQSIGVESDMVSEVISPVG